MVTDRQQERPLADELYLPTGRRSIRQLPGLTGGAVRLVWQSARWQLVSIAAIQAVSGALLAAGVVATRQLLAQVLTRGHHGLLSATAPWLGVLAGLFVVTSLLSVARLELQRLLSELVSRHSVEQVIAAATAAELLDFETPSFHDRLQRATVNAAIRPFQMTTGLLGLGSSGLSAVAVAVALATIDPWLTAVVIVAVVPVTIAASKLSRSLYLFSVEQTPLDRQRLYLQQLLTQKDPAKEVRAFDLAPYLGRMLGDLYDQRLAALGRLIKTRFARAALASVAGGLCIAGALTLLVLFVDQGRISLAAAGAAGAALLLFANQAQAMSGGVAQLYESALFIRDFNEFVRPAPTSPAPTSPAGEEADGAADGAADGEAGAADVEVGRVEARGLSFAYPSRSEPSIEGIDLTIEPGSVVALVGRNGSGKTTLAKLLIGLYQPSAGVVTWAGKDLRSLPVAAARRHVAVLFQDFVHYFMSIGANIGMGSWRDADDRPAIESAARRAGVHDFAMQLPDGYDTLLGPQFLGGSDLSGGQWQRLALARAFFRDASLVILDEPTASLDPEAEAELFASVREIFAGRTVLLITHRFANVRTADCVYVLDAGSVVEHGTHDQLMTAGGLYAELFRLQAETITGTGQPSPADP